ncbi:hypothetical protein ACFQX6_07785 [Streptosporangium lutulentum]
MASTASAPRALVFATVCVAVAGDGHALGGGLIALSLTPVGMVFAFVPAYALSARGRGRGVPWESCRREDPQPPGRPA